MKDTITLPRSVVERALSMSVRAPDQTLYYDILYYDIRAALDAPAEAPTAEPQTPVLTKGQARAILDMALELEKTGRIVSLSEGQERSGYVARNRNIQCALEDYLRNLTEPAAHGIKEGS